MRYLLPLFLIFPLMANQVAFSVDEAFPDPYAPYYDGDDEYYDDEEDDCCAEMLYDCYDGDLGEAWNYENDNQQRYPGRNTDQFMDELTQPWQ